MRSSAADDEIYQPVSKNLAWFYRAIFGLGVCTFWVISRISHSVNLMQLAVLAAILFIGIETMFQLMAGRRRRLLNGGISTPAVVARKYETMRSAVCKVVAKYVIEGRQYESEGTVSPMTYYRLAVGRPFQILVSPRNRARWMFDVHDDEKHLEVLYAILSEEFESGESAVSERHNEHQP